MDKKEMSAMLEATMKEVLPAVVEATVEAKTVEKFASLEKEIAELNRSFKIGNNVEEKTAVAEAQAKVGAFFKSLAKCKNNTEIEQKTATFMNEGTDAEGGYTVPTEFAKEVFRQAGVF